MNKHIYNTPYHLSIFMFLVFSLLLSTGLAAQQVISFGASNLVGENLNKPTSLDIGPDGRLYVAQQDGKILAYTVTRDGAPAGAGTYTVTDTETIWIIKNNIQNHNDDGTQNNTQTRQVTGLLATGTVANPVLYVTSSDWRISVGEDTGLDTNSGVISRLTWNGTSWVKVDIVRGFPRCEENHSINGMDLDETTNTLYVMMGGNTNKGAPGNNFSGTPEYWFSGALVSVDLDQINSMIINNGIYTDPRSGTQYVYDLPTLDDPTRPNITNADNEFPYPSGHPMYGAIIDSGDPFGGNNGLNMAFAEPGGPVQIYSDGYRNAYDVVFTENGALYTSDNGPNSGWGGQPLIYDSDDNPAGTVMTDIGTSVAELDAALGPGWYITNGFNEDGSSGEQDWLHYIASPGYYGGHPAPIRAFPSKAGIIVYEEVGGSWNQVGPTYQFGDLLVNASGYFNASFSLNDFPDDPNKAPYNVDVPGIPNRISSVSASTNGICEYTATNFNGAMQGNILTASYNGNINRYELNPAGDDGIETQGFFSGFGNAPLDVIAQGDNDPFPGTVWAATYSAKNITIFEPSDFGSCYQPGDPEYVGTDDYDNDGYSNDDEIDNGTNHCSGGSFPNDNDGDFISDLNDDDDDNDGTLDKNDAFAIDADNGLTTYLPTIYPFWNNDPGTGFFGIGFTGLMINYSADYLDQFDPNFMAAGGATGKLGIEGLTSGDASPDGNNDQEYAFQYGVNNGSDPFTVHGKLEEPFFNVNGSPSSPVDFQSFGIFLGTGDQDNYLKIVFNAQGGSGGIQVFKEEAGMETHSTDYTTAVVGNILTASSVSLYLNCDPVANTVQPFVSIDNGNSIVTLGTPVSVPASWLDPNDGNALAVGVIGTSRGSGTPFDASWDFLNVTEDSPAELVASTSPVNFGQVFEGTGSVAQDLRVTNVGSPASGAIEVTGISFSGPDQGEFSFVGSLPITIGPGNIADIQINFNAGPIGVKSANVELVHTGNNTPLVVPLNAEVVDNLTVLYRVNAAGGNLAPLDPPNPGWDFDTNSNPSTYRNSGSNTSNTSADVIHSSVPVTTPAAVWGNERWDPAGAPDMQWDFPAATPGIYTVRLYFLNSYAGTSSPGQRVFDVSIENTVVLDNFDIVATYGHKVGAMEEFIVTVNDGNLDIDFSHVVENPLINAIEILGPPLGDPPLTLDPIADQTHVSGETVNLPDLVNASGGNSGESYDYSATGLPTGVQIEPTSGNVFGTIDANAHTGGPANDGVFNVTITVEQSSSDPVSTSFDWTILASLPITLDPIPNQTNVADAVINLSGLVNASGGTIGESFTYGATGLPAGLQIDAGTGTISGTIDANAFTGGPSSDGVYSVTITADKPSDDPGSTAFTWTVLDPNNVNNVLYRINAGGGNKTALDPPNPDWVIDSQNNPSPYVNSGVENLVFEDLGATINNPYPNYPSDIFKSERYNDNGGTNLNQQWDFPVPNGVFTVNLLFSEIWNGASNPGVRIFDVEIEGNIVLDDYDVTADVGFETAVVKTFQVSVDDSNLDINFIMVSQNPSIKGIEILSADNSTNFPPIVSSISNQTSSEGNAVSLQVTANDGNGGTQTLTYAASNLPPGVTINPGTGLISGTIATDAHDNSPYTVDVTVSDNGDPVESTTVSFQWSILDPNLALWVDKPTPTNFTGRHECSFVQAGEHFFLFGGRESPTVMDKYDFQNDTWSQAGSNAPLPFNHFQAVEYQGLIWVIGAFKTNSFPTETPADYIYTYDPAADTWTQGPAIPTGPGVDDDRRRGSTGLVVYNDKFYVVGGIKNGHTDEWVPYLDEYDPATGTWTVLPDLPQARDHFHAAVIGDKLYVAGGRRSSYPNTFEPMIPEVDIFDFNTNTWTTLPAASNLPTLRAGCSAAVYDGKLFIMGGEGGGTAWSTTEALNVNTNTWQTMDALNHARHGFQAIVSGDGIYVVAGSPDQGGGNQKNMEYYGNDSATGAPLDPSELTGPALINIPANGSETVNLQNINGNQGIIVTSMSITGPDATDFSFVSGDYTNFLVGAGGSHAVEIAFNSDVLDKTAVLEVNDALGGTLTVDLYGPASTNNPPVVTTPADQTDQEGATVNLPIVADDGDGNTQTLAYAASGLPPGLAIDPNSGAISGTIGAGASAASPYPVTVTVTDDGTPPIASNVNFLWTVTPPPSADQVILSTVNVTTSNSTDWDVVNFTVPFTEPPVVVANPPSYNDPDPTTVRIRNITANGFEIQIDEWNYLDGVHGTETISYTAALAGIHDLNGMTLEMGVINNVDHNYVTHNFTNSFANPPVVVTSQTTANGATATTRRIQNLTASSFEVKVQEEEAGNGQHDPETIHYAAFSEGTAVFNGLTIVAGSTPSEVDDAWYTINFGLAFNTAPGFLAEMLTDNGTDPVALRYQNLAPSSVDVFLEEEQSSDSEMVHSANVVGYVAFGPAGDTPPMVSITAPADGATLTRGTDINFTATAIDNQDGDLAPSLSWSSDIDPAFSGTGGSITDQLIEPGDHLISAAVSDTDGNLGSDQITVTVPGPQVIITAPGEGDVLNGIDFPDLNLEWDGTDVLDNITEHFHIYVNPADPNNPDPSTRISTASAIGSRSWLLTPADGLLPGANVITMIVAKPNHTEFDSPGSLDIVNFTIDCNLTVTPTPVDPSVCNGPGSVSFQVTGGSGNESIEVFADGSTTPEPDLNNLPAGDYTYEVTDGLCLESGAFTIGAFSGGTSEICDGIDNDCDGFVDNDPTDLPVINTVDVVTPSSCGVADGSITIDATGSSGALEFSIDGGNTWDTDGSFTSLGDGSYDVIVRYPNGSCEVLYSGNPVLLSPANIPLINSVSSTDPTACGALDGTITIDATSGSTLEYSIDNGNTWSSSNVFFAQGEGTYDIAVQNDDGSCLTFYDNNPVTLTDTGTTEVCDGIDNDCDGQVDENVSGCGPTFEQFILVDANADVDIFTINDGDIIALPSLPTSFLNIRGTTIPYPTGSVYMALNGPLVADRIENGAPYALFGDNNGDYKGKNFPPGSYTLTGTAYTGSDQGGDAGPTLTISFELVNVLYNVNVSTDGNGTFSILPDAGPFVPGASVTVQGIPDADYGFLNWTDGQGTIVSTDNPYTFTVNSDVTLQANFQFLPCNGAGFTTYYEDNDGDGYGDPALFTEDCSPPAGYVADGTDCDDNDMNVHPGATEICDGIDNDCDGLVDNDDNDVTGQGTWYADSDGDGYGDPAVSQLSCGQPIGYVANDTDCDDTQVGINPGATEICDGIDNDCDGLIDDDDDSVTGQTTWYLDDDGDGFGDPGVSQTQCDSPAGYVVDNTDCDDTDPNINPDAFEIGGDGIDQNCDGSDAVPDNDGDGFDVNIDCDDNDPDIYPGAPELCDGLDNNCDGQIDEGLTVDADGDGYSAIGSCGGSADDCDDNDPDIYPGAPELCDGLDNNCDGQADEGLTVDADGDGYSAVGSCGGSADDCDDNDPNIHPDAVELCDGLDNNCDGQTDEGFDGDGDGFTPCGGDCDDSDPAIFPGAAEVCDGIDNNCDGTIDEGFDLDGDGVTTCGGDCDDDDASVFPGATEVCDGVDNNCDGLVDDAEPGVACNNSVTHFTLIDADADTEIFTIIDGNQYVLGNLPSDFLTIRAHTFPEPTGSVLIVLDGPGSSVDVSRTENGAPYAAFGDSGGNYNGKNFPLGLYTVTATPYTGSSQGGDAGTPLTVTFELVDQPSVSYNVTLTDDGNGTTTGGGSYPAGNNVTVTATPNAGFQFFDWTDDQGGVVSTDNPYVFQINGDVTLQANFEAIPCGGAGFTTFYADTDGDGFGDPGSTTDDCSAPAGYVANADDCDDADPNINPNAAEICDGLDNNCDGQADEGLTVDADGDGYSSLTSCGGTADDCDDSDPNIHPDALEICDGVDNNCDGQIDEGLDTDADGDGYTIIGSCTGTADDCDDSDPNVHPDATEICDGIDNNCDGQIDEGFDLDADGVTVCAGDCDDSDPTVYTGAPELCDGLDNDCNGQTDEGLTVDADGDGYTSLTSCGGSADDCDDNDPSVFPGATEVCDGVDNDCDGLVDNDPSCTSGPLVTQILLIDANADVSIAAINDGDVFSLATLPTDFLNIEAVGNGATESMELALSGPISTFRVESSAPYALFGDDDGDFRGKNFSPGIYTITATPFTGNGASGDAGPVVSANFEIVAGGMNNFNTGLPTTTLSDQWSTTQVKEINLYPNPATNVLNIDLRAFTGQSAEMAIYNDLGQKIWDDRIREVEAAPVRVDLLRSGFPDGVYLLEMKAGDGSLIIQRFVVRRD